MVDKVGVGLATYVVSFSRVLQEVKFTVPGCLSVAHSAGRLSVHFMHRHFRSKVVVVQDGKELLPCCDLCGMNIPARWLIRHRKTSLR